MALVIALCVLLNLLTMFIVAGAYLSLSHSPTFESERWLCCLIRYPAIYAERMI